MTFQCRICGSTDTNETFVAREIDIGIGSQHEYGRCVACNAISIVDIPEDLARYYADEQYYSLLNNNEGLAVSSGWKQYLLQGAMLGRGPIWAFFARMIGGSPAYRHLKLPMQIARIAGLRRRARVLDVGCGSTHSFDPFRQLGFAALDGCDPFLPDTLTRAHGTIYKSTIEDLTSTSPYDLILFSHSLEHMENQVSALKSAVERLSEGGTIVVIIPMGEGAEIEKYGAHSTLFEAPRHFVLHSNKSIRLLFAKAGLTVTSEVWSQALRTLCRSHYHKIHADEEGLRIPDGYRLTRALGGEVVADLERLRRQVDNIPGQAGIAMFCVRPEK